MALTHSQLKRLLHYDPKTGIFTWLVNGKNQHQRVGKRAGGRTPDGRFTIGVAGHRYAVSRLAVFYMTGQWPQKLVDHKNCDGSDNRWSNLREATSSQNLHNMRIKNGNRVGFKGVIFDKYTGRYRARIRVNYRLVDLGRFDTPDEAHIAYIAAAKKYYGEFARAK
jgi:hypothetical protein